MRKLALGINIIFLILLAACSSETGTPVAVPTIPTAPTEAPGKPEAPGGTADVIRFTRSGGFAGLDEEWVVTSDGVVSLNGEAKATVTETQLDQLLVEVEGLGFFEMQNTYLPQDTCCDKFSYTLTIVADGQKNTVSTIDAAEDAPAELWEIIGMVTEFLAENPE